MGSGDNVQRMRSRFPRLLLAAASGHLLGTVPSADWTVLTFTNGATTAVASRGSAHDAIDAMAALVDDDRAVEAAVGYAGSAVEDSADLLAAMVGRSPHVVSVERYRVGPSIGAHTGPISFGLFWWPTAS